MKNLSIGIIGCSEGNGHPYSFSAIFNGYNKSEFEKSDWEGILAYLEKRNSSDFGICNAKVTHVWSQDRKESELIAASTNIFNVVDDFLDMIGEVDAVIIARDDFETHLPIAKPFLESGIPVFIDKPLTLDLTELSWFEPFIIDGLLMSCSGLNYARELDDLRNISDLENNTKLIYGTVIKSWEKYAIHLLDPIYGIIPFDVESIQYNACKHESFSIKNNDGSLIQINALGKGPLTIRVEFFTDSEYYKADMLDSFTAFKRTLIHFVEMIRTKKPPIDPSKTVGLMKLLIAGKISKETGVPVPISQFK